jgi:hypothetical protein
MNFLSVELAQFIGEQQFKTARASSKKSFHRKSALAIQQATKKRQP